MLDSSHSTQVKGISGIGLIGTDTTLAENNLAVALAHDVLRCIQPLIKGSGQAPLQHNRLVNAANFLQKAEVLHVAGTNLQHVCILGNYRHCLHLGNLGNNLQAGCFTGSCQILQSQLLQSLEGIRGSPRLVGTATDKLGAPCLGNLSRLQELLLGLNSTRTCHNHQAAITDLDAVHINHGRLRMELTAYQLVALGDVHRLLHALEGLHVQAAHLCLVADNAHNLLGLALHNLGSQAQILHCLNNFFNTLCTCIRMHNNNHKNPLSITACPQQAPFLGTKYTCLFNWRP